MKVLLDECVPTPLRKFLVGHDIATIDDHGWKGISNGTLVAKATGVFELLITAATRPIAILELPTPHWPTLHKHGGEIQRAVDSIKPNEYVTLTF